MQPTSHGSREVVRDRQVAQDHEAHVSESETIPEHTSHAKVHTQVHVHQSWLQLSGSARHGQAMAMGILTPVHSQCYH